MYNTTTRFATLADAIFTARKPASKPALSLLPTDDDVPYSLLDDVAPVADSEALDALLGLA